jgi:protein gp37
VSTTSIEWTDKTWNPVRGCSIVSPGCVNCYAMKQAHRFSGPGGAYEGLTKQTKAGPQWTGKVVWDESKLLEPLSWRKPCRVFVNSMSDLFHESVPDAFIDKVFAVMALAPRHAFQVLTKRVLRMRDYVLTLTGSVERMDDVGCDALGLAESMESDELDVLAGQFGDEWPLSNVWLGVSCEDQQRADERIPLLLQTPAAVRFVSAEPLLGPIDFTKCGPIFEKLDRLDKHEEAVDAGVYERRQPLNWVIVGGESGPGARPMDLAWARSIFQQSQAANVACFVKQLGARPWHQHDNGTRFALKLRSRKGGDPAEWPEDLRVRECPEVRA